MANVSEPSISSRHDPVLGRLVFGIRKLGDVLRNEAWLSGQAEGLTPTQGQILVLLRGRRRAGLRLADIASDLRITSATASDAVKALVGKELVDKGPSPDDARAIAVRLTAEGRQTAWRVMQWSNFMADALQSLSGNERDAMMRGISKAMRALSQRNQMPGYRMCVSCAHFEPEVFGGRGAKHRCGFGDFAFGDADLRLDCSAFSAAAEGDADRIWAAFAGNGRDK